MRVCAYVLTAHATSRVLRAVHDSPLVMVWDRRERKMGSEVNLRLVQFIRILKGCGGGGSRPEAGTRRRSAELTAGTHCGKVHFVRCMTKVDKGNTGKLAFLYSLHVR